MVRIIKRIILLSSVLALVIAPNIRAARSPFNSRDKADGTGQGRRLALVIGIDLFRDPNWRPLNYAVADARDMAKAFYDHKQADFDKVIKLDDPLATSRRSIFGAIRLLGDMNTSPDDVVVIYISTHGTLARDHKNHLRQYLVAYDTDFDNIQETAIDMGRLYEVFNNFTSGKKVLIVASCHSGMGKSVLPDDVEFELDHLKAGGFFVKPVEYAGEASVVIGVCSWGETAEEDPELGHDIYTYFFLEGMGVYDRNGDGAVSISEAHDYAERKTYYHTNGTQHPFVRSDIPGADPIVLTGKVERSGKPVVVGYSENFEGAMIKLNGAMKGPFPDSLITEPGWNRIRVARRGSNKDFFSGLIYVRKGERVDLDRLVSYRDERSLGLVTNYRSITSEELRKDVIPGLTMYGLAYRVNSFPVMNTSLHFTAAYGQTDFVADISGGYEADVKVRAIETNVALLYNHRGRRSDYFIGPVAGAFWMSKYIEVMDVDEQRELVTAYPGVMGGMNMRLSRDVHFEVSDRISYQYLVVDKAYEGALVNEVSITLYFRPAAVSAMGFKTVKEAYR